MNKRSALAIAAGLVLTLIVGGLAVAAGLTGPTVSSAVPDADRRSAPEPVVRTVRRTVTVHKKADARVREVVQVAAPASSSSGPSGSDDDDAYEDDAYEDDAYEDEGHDDRDDHDEDEGHDDRDEDHGDDD